MPQLPKPLIAVIGPSADTCTPEIYDFSRKLGKALAAGGYNIATGGLYGIMEAVFKGAKDAPASNCTCVGIIPSAGKEMANPFCDVVISTGMGIARNFILVQSADAVVALGGGAGTLSELTIAWQTGKKVICCTQFEGWAREFSNRGIDNRNFRPFVPAKGIKEILKALKDTDKTESSVP